MNSPPARARTSAKPAAASSTLDAAAWLHFQVKDAKRLESFIFDRGRSWEEIKAIFDHLHAIEQKRKGGGHANRPR